MSEKEKRSVWPSCHRKKNKKKAQRQCYFVSCFRYFETSKSKIKNNNNNNNISVCLKHLSYSLLAREPKTDPGPFRMRKSPTRPYPLRNERFNLGLAPLCIYTHLNANKSKTLRDERLSGNDGEAESRRRGLKPYADLLPNDRRSWRTAVKTLKLVLSLYIKGII